MNNREIMNKRRMAKKRQRIKKRRRILILVFSLFLFCIYLLFLLFNKDTNDKIKIAIDAGHGYDTAGKRTPPMPQDIDFNQDGIIDVKQGERIKEHTANVGVAFLLSEELERCGFEVIKIGFDDENPEDDEDISLEERQKAIKKAKCDYSISIHFNAFGDGESFNSAEGMEVYIHDEYTGDSQIMADHIHKYLVQGTEQVSKGILPANFAICNTDKMNTIASILIECAYMTNLHEAVNLMGNEEYWKETAIEISKGMCEYTGVPYIPFHTD